MPTLQTARLAQLFLSSDFFFLQTRCTARSTHIKMQFLIPTLYTSELPLVSQMLEHFLPTIFRSQCFNYDNAPFVQEVRDTEIGHLFEHILLEYLCELRVARGHSSATFSGITSWNWKREARGTFHIVIHSGYCENIIIVQALNLSIQLLNRIIHENTVFLSTKVEQTMNDKQATILAPAC